MDQTFRCYNGNSHWYTYTYILTFEGDDKYGYEHNVAEITYKKTWKVEYGKVSKIDSRIIEGSEKTFGVGRRTYTKWIKDDYYFEIEPSYLSNCNMQ